MKTYQSNSVIPVSGGQVVSTTATVDFDNDDQITGIEILNLAHAARLQGVQANITDYANSEMRVSFDEVADALYIKNLSSTTASYKQARMDVAVLFDDKGRLVAVTLNSNE